MNMDTIMLHSPKETLEGWEFPATMGKRHCQVSVRKIYWQKLTGGTISARELTFRSLLFLLERESKDRILSKFDLEEIPEYFPEYEERIISTL